MRELQPHHLPRQGRGAGNGLFPSKTPSDPGALVNRTRLLSLTPICTGAMDLRGDGGFLRLEEGRLV
jgi:hypothetical protein